jgi:hypothetical protein
VIENWCISVDFRRILGVGSELFHFADYQINLISFEKGSILAGFDQISNQKNPAIGR